MFQAHNLAMAARSRDGEGALNNPNTRCKSILMTNITKTNKLCKLFSSGSVKFVVYVSLEDKNAARPLMLLRNISFNIANSYPEGMRPRKCDIPVISFSAAMKSRAKQHMLPETHSAIFQHLTPLKD